MSKTRDRNMQAAAEAIAAQILERETSPLRLTYDDVRDRFDLEVDEGICAPLANAIEAALEKDTGEPWSHRLAVSFFELTLEGRHASNVPTALLHVVVRAKARTKEPALA